jgi:dCMP deaminase
VNWQSYYLSIAAAVAARGSCSRRKVGAVIVVDGAIVSTGYNGTPSGVRNCNEGGCDRCAGSTPPGAGYELCLCVHAEQNAISQAARRGNATDDGTLYCTLRPCFGCVKSAVQAGIYNLVYSEQHDGAYDVLAERTYERLLGESGATLTQNL